MLGYVLDGVEIHERQECVECAIAWKYHTGDHLLPGDTHEATFVLSCSAESAASMRISAAAHAASAQKPRSPLTAPAALPPPVECPNGIQALRHFLHHFELYEHGRLFQNILYLRPYASASRTWLMSSARMILQQARQPASAYADAAVERTEELSGVSNSM